MASITQTQSSARTDAQVSLSLAARLIPASLLLGAGAVHLAMAPIHAPESTGEAVAFAFVGWAQIALAIALLLRPARPVLLATVAVNAGIIVAYIVSRTGRPSVGRRSVGR